MYPLVMISINLSETTQKKSALEIRDKIQSETKSKNFFSDKIFFLIKILGFCHGLNLSWTEFCLRLHTAVVFRMQSFNFCNVIVLPDSIQFCIIVCDLFIVATILWSHWHSRYQIQWQIPGGGGRCQSAPSNGTQFFHFHIRFCQKVPAWEVDTPPPPTGNP